jgi:hypothetical protein
MSLDSKLSQDQDCIHAACVRLVHFGVVFTVEYILILTIIEDDELGISG